MSGSTFQVKKLCKLVEDEASADDDVKVDISLDEWRALQCKTQALELENQQLRKKLAAHMKLKLTRLVTQGGKVYSFN